MSIGYEGYESIGHRRLAELGSQSRDVVAQVCGGIFSIDGEFIERHGAGGTQDLVNLSGRLAIGKLEAEVSGNLFGQRESAFETTAVGNERLRELVARLPHHRLGEIESNDCHRVVASPARESSVAHDS